MKIQVDEKTHVYSWTSLVYNMLLLSFRVDFCLFLFSTDR